MKTGGHGNEALMILVPLGVLAAFAVILTGGPVEALQVVNTIVGEGVRAAMGVVHALFS